MPLLEDLQCVDINLLHQAELLLFISNQLVIHVHQDPSIGEQLGIQDALFVEEGAKPDKFLLGLELQLHDFLLSVLVVCLRARG